MSETVAAAEKAAERIMMTKASMRAGKDLQAGRLSETGTSSDPKWHQMFPDTVSTSGYAKTSPAEQPHSGQHGVPRAGEGLVPLFDEDL